MNIREQELRLRVQDWAEEEARKDLAFSGEGVFNGISGEKAKAIKDGLIYYARNAAARTFDSLRLHGHLKTQ